MVSTPMYFRSTRLHQDLTMHRIPQAKDFIKFDKQFETYYGYVIFVDGNKMHVLKEEDIGTKDPVHDTFILGTDVNLKDIVLVEHCKAFRFNGERYVAS